jgi:hypothetical protein
MFETDGYLANQIPIVDPEHSHGAKKITRTPAAMSHGLSRYSQ